MDGHAVQEILDPYSPRRDDRSIYAHRDCARVATLNIDSVTLEGLIEVNVVDIPVKKRGVPQPCPPSGRNATHLLLRRSSIRCSEN